MAVEAVGDVEGGLLRHRESEHLELLAAFQRYRVPLRRLCLRSGVRLQDVDDVVQEALAVVLDGYVRKQVRSIGAWLFGVLRKQVSTYHSRRKHLDSCFVPLDYLDPEAELRRACPDEHGKRSISRVDLRAALLALRTRDRLLIVLKARGHSSGEVAQAVAVSPNSIRSLYGRAIKRMRKRLFPL